MLCQGLHPGHLTRQNEESSPGLIKGVAVYYHLRSYHPCHTATHRLPHNRININVTTQRISWKNLIFCFEIEKCVCTNVLVLPRMSSITSQKHEHKMNRLQIIKLVYTIYILHGCLVQCDAIYFGISDKVSHTTIMYMCYCCYPLFFLSVKSLICLHTYH